MVGFAVAYKLECYREDASTQAPGSHVRTLRQVICPPPPSATTTTRGRPPFQDNMNDHLRDDSLRDYLHVLHARRGIIIVAVLVCTAVAFGLSVMQEPLYRAEARLIFRDASADLNLVGTPAAPSRTADQLAALGAQTIESPATLRAVRRDLQTSLSLAALESAVSAETQAESNLVLVTATSRNGRFAARLANAVAREAVDRRVAAERRRFSRAAADLRRQLRALEGDADDAGTRSIYAGRILNLESLSTLAQPVEIARRAETPSTPVRPKPIRNTVLGALLGLLLGLGLAFARHSLDRRLHGAREIHEELDLPLIGHVREEAMGTAGPKPSDGRAPADVDREAFRILRANLDFLGDGISLVAVTSALPEEGKSTVAASLAFAASATGKRVLLVECDLRRPSLSERLALRRAPGLSDYLNGTASPEQIVQFVDTALPASEGRTNGRQATSRPLSQGFACVMAGSATDQPSELLSTARFQRFLEEVKSVYDLVVVDTSPLLAVADTLQVLPLVDALLFCVRDGRSTREQVTGAKLALGHLPERPAGLVVTGLKKNQRDNYGYYSYSQVYGPT